MKRWISLLLSLLLLCAALPSAAAAHVGTSAGTWDAVQAIEDRAAPKETAMSAKDRTALYVSCVDEMIRAVQTAPDYVPGSLERHGSFFFWETRDGKANGYSPSLRAELLTQRQGDAERPEALDVLALASDPSNIPDNRDVGIFMSYPDSWYFHPELCAADGQKLADSTGGELHAWMGENANVDTLAQAIESCGILLINTHGRTDYEAPMGNDHTSRANSSYICLPTGTGITAADQAEVTGSYGKYRHAFYAGPNEDGTEQYYCVDGTCIRNHMTKNAPHSAVYMGCCLGMATEGLFAPLRAAGVEVLLGFSERVITNTDHAYRAVFCEELNLGADFGQAVTAMKEQVGCPDPIETDHEPAWPIVVSSEDPYPGRDHLNEGQTVQSGWELYPAYPIELCVEPAGSADVSITRTYVTVTPRDGFLFSDWELTEGEATAERNGNVLRFTLSGPVSVTLHMEARTPATLCFLAGPGQHCEPVSAYENDEILLPVPVGELEADAYVYHFLGWSREALSEDTTERPPLLPAGSMLTLAAGDTTLYAVYGYYAPEDGTALGQFRVVSEEPADWAGDYVLTYQSTKALRASGRITGQGILGPSAVATDTGAGYFVDGDWLNEVSNELVWSFIPQNDAWLLKMKTSENYLAVPSSNVLLSTLTDPGAAGAQWRLQWTDGTLCITNKRFPTRILQYSTGSSGFCTLTSLRLPLTLYRRVPGEHRYTTQPLAAFRFTDVSDPGAYYYTPVYWALHHRPRITAGTSAATFSPDASCTRCQIVTFLFNAVGRPAVEETGTPFHDVPADVYYTDPVLWAVACGVTAGTGDGCFSPDAVCTRAQIVTFLWAAAGKPAPVLADSPFTDVEEGDWYRTAVLWAVENGVTGGIGNNQFGPDLNCTRAQAVTFLYKAAISGFLQN